MNCVLLPNFFFEEELQSTTVRGSKASRRLAAELAPIMGLLEQSSSVAERTSPGDRKPPDRPSPRRIVVVSETTRPTDVPTVLQDIDFLTIKELAEHIRRESQSAAERATAWRATPWGCSEAAVDVFRTAGLSGAWPRIDAVRLINSRRFQSLFDESIEVAGTGSMNTFGKLCSSMTEVTAAIRDACRYSPHGWVIKADLSHASRNRILGTSAACNNDQLTWLATRFSSGELVYVEPWVKRISECGLQFMIPSSDSGSSEVEFIGAVEMLTDSAGHYQGSVVVNPEGSDANEPLFWRAAIAHGRKIALKAAAAGYRGPLGIDCMLFQSPTDDHRWLRMCHDINGRLTMGRIALSLRKWLKAGESGLWIHSTAEFTQQNQNRIDEVSCSGVRIIPTSPGRIGGQAMKIQTALFASADPERLSTIRTLAIQSGFGKKVQEPIT
ncbi:MAG: hypothetical protein KDB01_05815 [Planctomycetaceae bacterium]|nr:hypothetical protein [Planctomycetaceae bacterium]